MKKTIFALATAAALAIGTLGTTSTADARCYGCAVGAGVAAGVIGGAIIGGAIANSAGAYPAYAPAPGYVVYQGYGAPYPVACPGGYWARRPLRDPYGHFVVGCRPRFVCRSRCRNHLGWLIPPTWTSAREDTHEEYDHCARRGRHPGRGVAASGAG